MPQMAPISWLTLFILFSVLYILFTILNYFSVYPKPLDKGSSSMKFNISPMNWEW